MFPRTYFPQTYFTADFWPQFATTPLTPTGGGWTQGPLDVGGDGIAMLTGFVTLSLSFPYQLSMRTE